MSTSKNVKAAGATLPQPRLTEPALTSVDPIEILHAVRRRWWILFLAVSIVGATFCVGSMRQPRVYRAVATVVIDPVLPRVLGENYEVDDLGARAAAESLFYNTQYNIMHSRSVIREAITRLRLADDPAFCESYRIRGVTGEAKLKWVEGVVGSLLEIAPEHQSRIAKLIVEDYDADRAAHIANTLGQVYIDLSLENRLQATRSASKWLDVRVDDFSKQLDGAEKALNDFRKENMLVSVSLEDRKNMVAGDLTALNGKLIDIRAKQIELEAERTVLKTADEGKTDFAAIPRISRSDVMRQLRSALVDLQRRKADLESRYGAKHPNIEAIQNDIDEVHQQIKREIGVVTATLDNEIEEQKDAEASLREEIAKATKRAMELNTLGLEYGRLERESDNTKKTYESLLKRQTETGLSGQLESNFVRWLETAEPVWDPVRPMVMLNTILGALLGLVLGLGMVVGGVLLDNTIHSQIDVEERLRLVFLGLLPNIEDDAGPRKKKKERVQATGNLATPRARDMFILENPTSSVAECARSLRTNLLFLGTDRPLKRLLLTSAGPAEGKSTTVVALGTTMAIAGNKVLLVDTDLRRPRLHKTFGVSSEHGLTNVLLETASLDTAIKSTGVPGLDVLPCGPLPPNPSELLHTERFQKLLAALEARYDRILFDSPPVNAVTDATILAQMVEGTILVVQASKTSKEAARRASRHLANVNAKLLGVVLNHVDLRESSYYYRHYFYHYRHGYTYGAEPEAPKS
jgi:capsular exopolysaccharide synthesis family protein